jgi:hypothetical protein
MIRMSHSLNAVNDSAIGLANQDRAKALLDELFDSNLRISPRVKPLFQSLVTRKNGTYGRTF